MFLSLRLDGPAVSPDDLFDVVAALEVGETCEIWVLGSIDPEPRFVVEVESAAPFAVVVSDNLSGLARSFAFGGSQNRSRHAAVARAVALLSAAEQAA